MLPNKTKYSIRVFSLYGITIPFLAIIILRNLVKAQAPLNDYGEIYLGLFSFVRRQSEFAFFGAWLRCRALFLFSVRKSRADT